MAASGGDKPSEDEKSEILDYINAMSLELAIMADRAGCLPLGDHLRDAAVRAEACRRDIRHG